VEFDDEILIGSLQGKVPNMLGAWLYTVIRQFQDVISLLRCEIELKLLRGEEDGQ